MKPNEVPFEFLTTDPAPAADAFERLQQQPAALHATAMLAPAIGRLHGFDLLEQPVVSSLPATPGGLLPARSTVPLRRTMLGREVLVVFDNGDAGKPVIVGVLELHALHDSPVAPPMPTSAQVDGERQVIEAEREIVLKCGDASITLTRAGKVIIRGNYILSRSTGYNKIKGAAIDIN